MCFFSQMGSGVPAISAAPDPLIAESAQGCQSQAGRRYRRIRSISSRGRKPTDLLGFDDVRWVSEAPGIQRDVRNSWPSDTAIVDAILEVSRQAEPFFIFAFPASTHAPYNQGTYRQSGLDVAEPAPRKRAPNCKNT